MSVVRGQIVYSKAGRDKDDFFVVTKSENGFVLIANGKSRPIERPKRKSVKHIAPTSYIVGESELETNKSVRHLLTNLKVSQL